MGNCELVVFRAQCSDLGNCELVVFRAQCCDWGNCELVVFRALVVTGVIVSWLCSGPS